MYFTTILTIFAAVASALNGIVAPNSFPAGVETKVTFQDANSDNYRVYLAASLRGSNGPACYLINSTTLSDSVNLTIPPGVGPVANYYSIAIADLTISQGATYSNKFNLTGANGNYSEYENHLGGSPFWSADALPCTAYGCARACATEFYPADLTDNAAFGEMKDCILACDGVTVAASQTGPAHASGTDATATATETSTATEDGAAAATSSGAATEHDKNVVLAGAVAAGFGAWAFML